MVSIRQLLMLEKLKPFFRIGRNTPRPYRGLSEEELIERYARARNQVHREPWGGPVDECWHLMVE
jgi:hypothetical protein